MPGWRALLSLLSAATIAIILLYSSSPQRTSVITPATPMALSATLAKHSSMPVETPVTLTTRSPDLMTPSSIAAKAPLSLWDAELNAYYRGLLRLPPLLVMGERSSAATLPVAVNSSSGALHCQSHGQAQPMRSGARGEWTLRCVCDPGWSGPRCARREPSPCNTPEGGRVLTRCAGTCDDDVNHCLCGPGSRYPQRPMSRCQYEGVQSDMPWQTPAWGGPTRAPKTSFWYATATERSARVGWTVPWCEAEPGQRVPVRCKCYDGQDEGRLCEPLAPRSTDATFCLNQCWARCRTRCRLGADWMWMDDWLLMACDG